MPKVISLFAGCGGMDLGFEQAGYDVVAANEFWAPAAKTYRRNFKRTTMIEGDINDSKVRDDLVAACGGWCDFLVGGPPCQAYSLAGRRDPNDPRGRLFEMYVEMVERTRPRYTVMENVVGILSMKHKDGKVIDLIKERMWTVGYDIRQRTLDSAYYGVPQHRQRVIFIGRGGSKFNPSYWPFPQMTHSDQGDWLIGTLPFVTVRKAIGDIEEIPEDPAWNHVFTKHSKEYVHKISKTRVGTSVTGYSESCYRCPPDLPSKTVKANNGGVFIHYEKNRCMSARELARLQGFPDSFKFEGTKGDVLRQVGNAVPPPLAKAIAVNLMPFFEKDVEGAKEFWAESIRRGEAIPEDVKVRLGIE